MSVARRMIQAWYTVLMDIPVINYAVVSHGDRRKPTRRRDSGSFR